MFFGVSESIPSPPPAAASFVEFSSVELILGVADDVVLSVFLPDTLELSVGGLSVFLLDPLLELSVVDLSAFLLEPLKLSLGVLSLGLLVDPLPVSEIVLSAFFVEPLADESMADLSDFLPEPLPLSDASEAENRIA